MIVDKPENKHPIEEIFAFCSEDERGNHGVISRIDQGRFVPLVTAEPSMLAVMGTVAKRVGEISNTKVVLIHFRAYGEKLLVHDPNEERSSQASS